MIIALKKHRFYLLLLLVLTGCANSTIENAPWDNSAVPVVFSIISPNECVQVYINQTVNKNFSALKNPYPQAKVYISGPDNKWINLTRLPSDSSVFEDINKLLTIEKGKTYKLKVELSDRTVYAQTTVIPVSAIITDANCVFTGETDNEINLDSLSENSHFVYDTVYVNHLTVKYLLPNNNDYAFQFSAFSKAIYGTMYLNQGSFQDNSFNTPQNISSFILKFTTYDATINKYLKAMDINSLSDRYSYITPIASITSKFGGVLPQFSNIINGIGLFGSSVTDSMQVEIINVTK